MSYNKVSYVGLNCIDCPMQLSGLGCEGCLMGLGDSIPAIEQKAKEFLGKVALLNYLNVYNYSPTQFRIRDINGWYIFKSGTPVWDGYNVTIVINDYAPIQKEFKDFLKSWGYDDEAATHIAAYTSLSYISPMAVGREIPSDSWIHAWGTSPITDALSGGDLDAYKRLRNTVAGNIAEVHCKFTVIPPPSGLWWIPSPSDRDGSRAETKTAYNAFFDFVYLRILLMLQQTARTETAAETAIRGSILAKFQTLLGRAPIASEMSEWFLKIRDGGKTVADLDALIRTTNEYVRRNAPPPPAPKITIPVTTPVKQAGILDFLKSPIYLIGLGVVTLIVFGKSSKKKGKQWHM